MANKKVSQLVSKPSVLVTDLFPIADPTTGQLFKTTISDLGTAIGSGVSSVNTLVGAVVLDTDDIQELASPTNRWFTDTRARAALSASSPLAYNSGTGVFSIAQANGSTNGFLSSADWTTFNAKQAALSGTGFVKISGTTISYDNSTYLTTSAAASTYLALSGGTLTGALNGTSATFTGDLTLSATNPRLYFTDTDNNPDYFISNTDGTFTIYDVTNSQSRFTIGTTGNGIFGGNLTVGQIIRSGGTSSQFLKADGSVDSSTYTKRSGLTDGYLPAWSSSLLGGSLTDSFISYASNITYVSGMGLSTLNGLDIEGNYGAGGGGLKIRSYDETTGNAYIDFANTGGRMYLGLNRSTASGLMTNATAYATVLTTGLGTTNLEFGTNATKRMTIDGTTGAVTLTSALSGTSATFSGNVVGLQLGVGGQTPRTSSSLKTIESTNYVLEDNGNFGLKNNAYFNGTNNVYISSDFASRIFLGSGSYIYYDAPSGTAGGTVTFTPRFTIANGGAATFSSSVTATNGFIRGDLGTGVEASLRLRGSNSTARTTRLQFEDYNGTIADAFIDFKIPTAGSGTGARLDIGVNSPALTIVNGGNVGIGTTSPASKLDVVGDARFGDGNNFNPLIQFAGSGRVESSPGYSFVGDLDTGMFNPNTGNTLAFATGGTERMRITSGGHVLINRTTLATPSLSANGTLQVNNEIITTGSNAGLFWENRSGGVTTTSNWYGWYTSAGTIFLYNGSTNIASINSGNGIYTPLSDRNKKKDFEDSAIGLNEVMQLKPTLYRMKSESEDSEKQLGFIAQEVQGIIPSAYQESGDFIGLNYNPIVAALTKAVQELKAELDTLKNK